MDSSCLYAFRRGKKHALKDLISGTSCQTLSATDEKLLLLVKNDSVDNVEGKHNTPHETQCRKIHIDTIEKLQKGGEVSHGKEVVLIITIQTVSFWWRHMSPPFAFFGMTLMAMTLKVCELVWPTVSPHQTVYGCWCPSQRKA